MKSVSLFTSACFLSLALQHLPSIQAFFVMDCGAMVREAVDPIVHPNNDGSPSSHVHIVAGSDAFSGNLTYAASQAQDGCTTCPVPEDRSNYWAPDLFFHDKNKGFIATSPASFVIYYKFEVDGNFTAFPKGFRMRSGVSEARTYNPDNPAQVATTFKCLPPNQVTNGFPTQTCSGGLRAQVVFPQCGRGLTDADLYEEDGSHVAFFSEMLTLPPENGAQGTCPDSHPIKFPRLFMEVYYSSPDIDWSTGAHPEQPYVLANGDGTGYGMHADFQFGWKEGVLDDALTRCDGSNPATGNKADGRALICFPSALKEGQTPKACGRLNEDSPDLASHDKVIGTYLPQLPYNNTPSYTGDMIPYDPPNGSSSGNSTSSGGATNRSNGSNSSSSSSSSKGSSSTSSSSGSSSGTGNVAGQSTSTGDKQSSNDSASGATSTGNGAAQSSHASGSGLRGSGASTATGSNSNTQSSSSSSNSYGSFSAPSAPLLTDTGSSTNTVTSSSAGSTSSHHRSSHGHGHHHQSESAYHVPNEHISTSLGNVADSSQTAGATSSLGETAGKGAASQCGTASPVVITMTVIRKHSSTSQMKRAIKTVKPRAPLPTQGYIPLDERWSGHDAWNIE